MKLHNDILFTGQGVARHKALLGHRIPITCLSKWGLSSNVLGTGVFLFSHLAPSNVMESFCMFTLLIPSENHLEINAEKHLKRLNTSENHLSVHKSSGH